MLRVLFISSILLLIFSCKKDKKTQPDLAIYNIDHVDWSPDTTITDSVFLDLNGDAVPDLKFTLIKTLQNSTPNGGPYYNYSSHVTSLNNTLLLSLGRKLPPSPNSSDSWNCFQFNELISEQSTWENSFRLNYHVIAAGLVGTWDINSNAGYIGLKFMTATGTKWGWIKVTSTTTSIVLKEYAINQNFNQAIRIGQTQ